MELAFVDWIPTDPQEADEGLAHHFQVPGLADGYYEADVTVKLLGEDRDLGLKGETSFTVDSVGKCSLSAVGDANLAPPTPVRDGKVLVNVAIGATSWISSPGPSAEAQFANDGSIMVSSKVRNLATSSTGKSFKWWEVDLKEMRMIEMIDIFGPKVPAESGMYPPIVPSPQPLVPFQVDVLNSDFSMVASKVFAQLDFEKLGIFTWNDVGKLGRYVRISLPMEGGGRDLSLLEVSVYAWEKWNCSEHCPRHFGACPQGPEGACQCSSDRTGQSCETLLLTDHVFLPALTPTLGSQWDMEVFDNALQSLHEMQNPPDCTSQHAMVMGYHPGGLAASLNLIGSMVSIAYSMDKALLLWRKSEWFYADPDECPGQQMSCYFQPWSNCSNEEIDGFLEGAFHLKVEESPFTRADQPFAWVPREYEKLGIFWWHSVLNSFLMRLMPNLESDLALPMVLKKLGLEDQAFLGVHVRLGDSCVKWRELFKGDCIGIMEHIEAISFLTNRYSIAKVFVASDDPSAANIIQEALPHLGYGRG
mmetsp:Transcript_33991/g.52965  ORF Transcript_33991/g.52965 Transcript_33991/m.52965 type:complete len:533 (+) Transcript_33991:145-1743(+)